MSPASTGSPGAGLTALAEEDGPDASQEQKAAGGAAADIPTIQTI